MASASILLGASTTTGPYVEGFSDGIATTFQDVYYVVTESGSLKTISTSTLAAPPGVTPSVITIIFPAGATSSAASTTNPGESSPASITVTSVSLTQLPSITPASRTTTFNTAASSTAASGTTSPTFGGNGGSKNNTSAGAIAGAAVGGVFGGVVLGFLAAFLFLHRRKSRSPPPVTCAAPQPDVKDVGPMPDLKGYPQFETPPLDMPRLSQYLLDVLPDNSLSSELRSSGQLIEAHSERNYHFELVQADTQALAQALANLGVGGNGSLSAEELVALALNPRTRQTAIRHVLARVLYTSIDFSSRGRLTMLPAPIAGFLQSIPPVERDGGNKDAYSTALSRWRALGAFLLHPQRSLRTPLKPNEDALIPQAVSLVNALNSFLDPFVPRDLKQQQANHLQLVIMECTKFGYVLFSQPNDWRLILSSGTSHRMAVVCAGLEKTSDQNGNPHAFPHCVLAPTLVQV